MRRLWACNAHMDIQCMKRECMYACTDYDLLIMYKCVKFCEINIHSFKSTCALFSNVLQWPNKICWERSCSRREDVAYAYQTSIAIGHRTTIVLHVFIKNVVAVAAYSRLASRSQAKFHTKKLSPLARPCAAAPAQSTTSAYPHFDFRLASERTWVLSLTEPVAFPGAFEDEDRRVVDCQKTRQLVPGCVFLVK